MLKLSIGYACTTSAALILYLALGCNIWDWRYWTISVLFMFGGAFTFGAKGSEE